MNSTSFTSIDPASASGSDKNIDTSSTAHLTLNAAGGRPTRSTRGSNNSDSDPDRSPSVTVLTSSGTNSHHHHHHSIPRPSQLITGGFSLSNRLHLTKHQRTLWSRATHFEKVLLISVIILCAICILLFISLASIIMQQRHQLELLTNQTQKNKNNEDDNLKAAPVVTKQIEPSLTTVTTTNNNKTKTYCLTPDCVKVAASVIEAIDLTVNPCDDFYVSWPTLLIRSNLFYVQIIVHLSVSQSPCLDKLIN